MVILLLQYYTMGTIRVGGVIVNIALFECGRSWVRAPSGQTKKGMQLVFAAFLLNTQP